APAEPRDRRAEHGQGRHPVRRAHGELEGDAPAERVPHDHGALHVELVKELAEDAGIEPGRVLSPRPVGGAVPREVRDDQAVATTAWGEVAEPSRTVHAPSATAMANRWLPTRSSHSADRPSQDSCRNRLGRPRTRARTSSGLGAARPAWVAIEPECTARQSCKTSRSVILRLARSPNNLAALPTRTEAHHVHEES